MRRAFFEAAVTRTHALLLLHRGSPAPWVAGSPVPFLVATPWWPPVRCAARLVFLWGADAQEGGHLVSSGGLLPAGAKGHVP